MRIEQLLDVSRDVQECPLKLTLRFYCKLFAIFETSKHTKHLLKTTSDGPLGKYDEHTVDPQLSPSTSLVQKPNHRVNHR